MDNLLNVQERREIVAGELPLCITLESREVAALRRPYPVFLSALRLSYLPQLIDRLHSHFEAYLQPSYGRKMEPWFEWCGIALDWRLPIGVLFDIFCGGIGEPQLPWKLTLHFHTGTPSINAAYGIQLLPYTGWTAFETVFLNELKLSTCVYNKSPTRFQQMKKDDEKKILNALKGGNIDTFYEIAQIVQWDSAEDIHSIPIRIHLWGPPYRNLLTKGQVYYRVTDMKRSRNNDEAYLVPQKADMHLAADCTSSVVALDALNATPTAVDAPNATPTAVDAPNATPTAVDAPNATPTAVDLSDATPTAVDAPNATPTAVDAPNATPTAVDLSDATPTAVDAPNATPTSVHAPNATPTLVHAPNATPTAVDAPNATPTAVDAPNATPTAVDAPNATPTSEDGTPTSENATLLDAYDAPSSFPHDASSGVAISADSPCAPSTHKEAFECVDGFEKTLNTAETDVETNTFTTLGDILHKCFPQLFPIISSMETGIEAVASMLNVEEIEGKWIKRAKVLVHGVDVPLNTPLVYSAANACQFDHCLHVVVRTKTAFIVPVWNPSQFEESPPIL